MPDHTVVNLSEDVPNRAPDFGIEGLEARFARIPLELRQSGLSYFKVDPGVRSPFGHYHEEQEEIYVIAAGSARLKLDDEIVELRQWDAVRVPKGVVRAFEGGADGAVILAYGAPSNENKDARQVPGWWDA